MTHNVSSTPQDSRYRFTERVEKGTGRLLRIEGEGRNTVFVAYAPTCLLVRYRDEAGRWFSRPYGFFDYYSFSASVARGLILGWEPPEGRQGWPRVHAWVRKRTGQAIGKRLHAFYKRCLSEVDPTVLALQRAVFAATCSTPR